MGNNDDENRQLLDSDDSESEADRNSERDRLNQFCKRALGLSVVDEAQSEGLSDTSFSIRVQND